jgi:hypothetical protein
MIKLSFLHYFIDHVRLPMLDKCLSFFEIVTVNDLKHSKMLITGMLCVDISAIGLIKQHNNKDQTLTSNQSLETWEVHWPLLISPCLKVMIVLHHQESIARPLPRCNTETHCREESEVGM